MTAAWAADARGRVAELEKQLGVRDAEGEDAEMQEQQEQQEQQEEQEEEEEDEEEQQPAGSSTPLQPAPATPRR